MEKIAYGLIVLLILWAGFSIEKYKYDDCKKVGHGTFYCLMKIGS